MEMVRAAKSFTTALRVELENRYEYKLVSFEMSLKDAAIHLLSDGFSTENEINAQLDLR